jgi:hypothetical protein
MFDTQKRERESVCETEIERMWKCCLCPYGTACVWVL